jgi:stage II sporulation protein D
MRRGGERTATPFGRGVVAVARVAVPMGIALTLGTGVARADEPVLRVLLQDGARKVRIDEAGRSRPHEVRVDGSLLRVDGRRRGAVVRFDAAGPDASGALRVDGRGVRGTVELRVEPSGSPEGAAPGMRVVNEVPLEAYVAGTLLGEVQEAWGETVLEAQAVATRSYALYRRLHAGSRGYDVEADTRGQVYLGLDGETAAVWDAVDATRGQVLEWQGEPILAAFHGTSGGRTASAAEVWGRPLPYLVSVPVEGEEASPDTYWRAPVAPGELARLLAGLGRGVGRVKDVSVASRTPSGRCLAVRIRGSTGEVLVPALDLRRALGEGRLRSTLFTVRPQGGVFVFAGSGRGHGVGMSQWGARVMAERGASYRAILERFYPGARLLSLDGTATAHADAGGTW